jgi:hypothetical protein
MHESSLRLRVGEISGGIESSQLSKKSTEGWCLEALKGGIASLCCRWLSSMWKNTLFTSAEVLEGKMDGQEFSMENSEVPRAVGSHRGARRLQGVFCKHKLKEKPGS